MTSGEPREYERGPKDGSRPREKYFITVAMGHKAPCTTGWKCPKGSPANEPEVTLSKKNGRTVLLYLQAKATGFHYVPEFDALLADNFRIIQGVYAAWEREQAHTVAKEGAANAALSLVASMRGG
ncbi:MAG: hypothetical protein E8D43_00015 [Nitrospira sp.]|nr:MAG: hypothetical protein E8D43_00015 [Nitrospira sp.]